MFKAGIVELKLFFKNVNDLTKMKKEQELTL